MSSKINKIKISIFHACATYANSMKGLGGFYLGEIMGVTNFR